MKNYKYIARNLAGIRKEGLKEAACPSDVLSWLREQDFTPVSISEISAGIKQSRRMPRGKPIKSGELAALCWQLTTMIEGGIPITAAIETISEDIENLQLQRILQHILTQMESGGTFSESIAEFPKVFNQLSHAMILAGETCGNLPEALHRLAEYFENRDKLAKKVKGAMTYPAFVFVFIILIVIFIMAFIIPRFRVIFTQIGGELPAFTRLFMGFYDMLRYNLVYIIGSLLLMITLGIAYSKTSKGHYIFSKIILALPLIGKVLSRVFITMFCRTMSTLLAAGVPILEVFDILSGMTRNDIIKAAVTQARGRIVEGSNISSSMTTTDFFPNMVIKMIQAGEESGSLSKVLERTADYYERKVDATITTMISLLEPIMIVTVGGIVLVVVLALYLPIFSMSNISQ